MPNYANSKIYKLTGTNSEGNLLTYYGSTTNHYLTSRLSQHKYDSRIGKYISSTQVVNCEDCQITLIELYPCSCKDELVARERFYIESNTCVNKNIAGRSIKESHKNWRLKNCQHINEYRKNWTITNPEYYKNWNINNSEYKKNWRIANRQHINDYNKKWKQNKLLKNNIM